jgi:hypothetical protein
MKLCVISNSHAGALKAGWESLGPEARRGVVPTFFAATGANMKYLSAFEGGLRARKPEVSAQLRLTSGGLDHIDPELYDAFWIHALGFRHLSWPEPTGAHYSRAFLLALTVAIARASQAFRIHALIRQFTPKPIFLSANPMHSETVAPLEEAAVPEPPSTADLEPILQGLLDEASTLLFQPAETITRRYYTSREYSDGSARLHVRSDSGGDTHPAEDFAHMNARYGERVWQQVLAQLASA